MSPTTVAPKSKFRFLDANTEALIAQPVSLDGTFILTPPKFEPLEAEPELDDGVAPSAVGLAFMEFWAAATGRPAKECPTGMVRAIEAVSATGENVAEVRRAVRGGTVRWRRNHAGLFCTVSLQVIVPLVGRATVQPRENAHYGRIARDKFGESIIYEVDEGLRLRGRSAKQFGHIRVAQTQALEPGNYTKPERKDFTDSLALEGIREELRGFCYELTVNDGPERGHHVETDDGYTRVAVAQTTIANLIGLPADLSRMHWDNGDGTQTIRPWTAASIKRAHEALRFDVAPFTVWPQTETTEGVRKWLNNASNEAQAVLRLMTARMDVGIHVKPYKGGSTHMVVFGDMARFHVKGHQPVPWTRTDDEAFKARTIVSHLQRDGLVNSSQRAVFFGEQRVPWKDDASRSPYRNKLVATVDTMVQCVVDDPLLPTRYATVRSALKAMRVPNSPSQASASASSLAAIVAGLEEDGELGAFVAMLKRSFDNASLRQLKLHTGDWTTCFQSNLSDLVASALAELSAVLGTAKHAGFMGPSMRALAVLGMVAHGMNPALIDYRKPKSESPSETIRFPSSLTMTGRGGRGGAGAVEAHVIVLHMAMSPAGIRQLEAIVRAVIDQDAPVVPRDASGVELLEDDLRRQWNREPTIDGEPRVTKTSPSPTPGGTLGEDGPEAPPERPELSERGPWSAAISELAGELRALAVYARGYTKVPAGPNDADVDEADWDPADDDLPRMLDKVGIDPEDANEYDEALETLRKFFLTGVMAYLKQKTRSRS